MSPSAAVLRVFRSQEWTFALRVTEAVRNGAPMNSRVQAAAAPERPHASRGICSLRLRAPIVAAQVATLLYAESAVGKDVVHGRNYWRYIFPLVLRRGHAL